MPKQRHPKQKSPNSLSYKQYSRQTRRYKCRLTCQFV